MPRQFDLNLLPVLVAIHEHRSVSLAAQHLGMSQSAVSTALAKLRLKYADPLFHRVGHGMKPTTRTRALINPLREAMSRVATTFTTETHFNPRTTERTFTFAMSDVGEMVFMPKILQRVHQAAPRAAGALRGCQRGANRARPGEPGRSISPSGTSPTCARNHSSRNISSFTISSACCAPITRSRPARCLCSNS